MRERMVMGEATLEEIANLADENPPDLAKLLEPLVALARECTAFNRRSVDELLSPALSVVS